MNRTMNVPPEISSTLNSRSIDTRFRDESALMNSVSLAGFQASPDIRFVEVTPDYRGPSFSSLAKDDPARLVALVVEHRLADHDLTFAAEAVGSIADRAKAVEVLLPLLQHASPLVREGAVYGLSRHLGWHEWARARLEFVAQEDPSPGVRDAAREALEP